MWTALGAALHKEGHPAAAAAPGMAARSRRSWFSVLLGLVLGFLLASRLIIPRAAELHRYSRRGFRHALGGLAGGCGAQSGVRSDMNWRDLQAPYMGSLEPGSEDDIPRDKSFLYVGVMTAQKYLQTRAVAAHR